MHSLSLSQTVWTLSLSLSLSRQRSLIRWVYSRQRSLIRLVYSYTSREDFQSMYEPARCFNESFCKTLFHAIWLLITRDKGSDEPAQMCILNTAFSTQRDTHPSQDTMSGHYRPASEMPSKWPIAGGPVVARF